MHKAVEVSEDVKLEFTIWDFRVDLQGENNRWEHTPIEIRKLYYPKDLLLRGGQDWFHNQDPYINLCVFFFLIGNTPV